jgi:hypothetical protein
MKHILPLLTVLLLAPLAALRSVACHSPEVWLLNAKL